MNLQELIELAILDAMGLLDEREQAGFEAAFRTASPAVQAQVRREQTRLSRIEAILPDVTAPAGLRAAVLEAVRAQIAATPAERQETVLPYILKSRVVSPLWRAASLGLAAAAVVFGITTFTWKHEYNQLQQIMQTDGTLAALTNQFGASYVQDVLFARDTKHVIFQPVAGFKGSASLWLNPEWKEAKFFAQSIASPEGKPYRLAIVDENDQVLQVIDTITSDGRLFSKNIALKASGKSHLAILGTTEQSQENLVVLSRAELAS